ncbi:MAG: hypothetical protein K8E24_012865 [Methanobacterium paludis]|nr:hypothetical protein [Methanobacterium paludis]
MLKFESKVSKSDPKSRSSRTIIPKEVINLLDVKWGDTIEWNVKIEKDSGITVCVSPKKE